MKKKVMLAILCGFFVISPALIAQDSTYIANEFAKALSLYQKAQKYNDTQMTRQALYNLLVLNERDSTVLRALGELYYNNRQFTSSALVGLDYVNLYPENRTALELVALSYEQLRLYDKAIEYYKPLWDKTNDINILYQMTYLEYSLKRFDDALTNLSIVESRIDPEEKIVLSTSDGEAQEVYFKAAVFNLEALIAIEQGNTERAKTLLNQALALSPEFESAKNVLDSLE